MRVQGYCTECQSFKWVRVASGDLWKLQVLKRAEGVCSDCEGKKR